MIQSIAFVTLFERHLLGGGQLRVGPNKVGYIGVFQAFFDGIKLVKKEVVFGMNYSFGFFALIPLVCFVFMLMYWFVLPYFYDFITFEYSVIFMICLVGGFVYCVLLSGIMSKSKYGLVGGLRARSQSVSYEVVFSLFILCLIFQISRYSFNFFFSFYGVFFILYYVFLVLAELNRAPFDFSEGERELVSGFNVEFSSVPFVLLFLSEYGSLLFFSVLFSVIFFGFRFIISYIFVSLMIFIRCSFPRFRYDKMMSLFWFNIIPSVLLILFFSVVFWFSF